MSKITFGLILTCLVAGLLPFVLVARSRASRSDRSPIHLVLDMDNQPRFDPQSTSPVFADGRAMRPQVPGTIAQEDLVLHSEILNDNDNPHLLGSDINISDPSTLAAVTLGRVRPENMNDQQFDSLKPPENDADLAADKSFYVHMIPSQVKVTPEFLRRGEERFNIYCAPCHGMSGYGDGMINARAQSLMATGTDGTSWTQPQNLNEQKIIDRPDGHIFNTITNGIRTMPPYDKQISIMDRWAIVAYVRALEQSQHASPKDVAAMTSLQAGK
ncbi:MAG TPA: cytochrome c [Phycisphaerae bacterium]|nr:cytochrome c [Phycisphaerae bacterium]